LKDETGVPGENHRPVTSHWHTWSHNVLSSTTRRSGIWTNNVSGDRHWFIGSYKSNYHTIATTMARNEHYDVFNEHYDVFNEHYDVFNEHYDVFNVKYTR
jgi:hypothetical protein